MRSRAIETNRTWGKFYAEMNLGLWGWGAFLQALRSHYLADNELVSLVNDASIP